ncbi:MAG: ABC transporter ATP-binding protein [Flavobacteriales bacterium]|nr:ABC transporter ATP-binding protein [Flavobacteriales bacterium]
MKSLSYLNKYFIKYKWRLLLGALFVFATNVFRAEMPDFFGNITDQLMNWRGSDEQNSLLKTALQAGGIYMFLSLMTSIFLFMTRQTIIIVSRLIEFDLKNEIYQQYQKLSFSYYKKSNTGDLVNRISEDVTKVRMYLGPGVMYSINILFLSILIIRKMLMESPFLTLVTLIPLPIMSYIIYKVSSRINKLSTTVQEEQSGMSTLVQETFTGIRVIKAYGRTEEKEDKFSESAENYKNKSMRLVLVNALFMPTIFVLIGVSTILCIYVGGLLHFSGDISHGVILKFIFYVNLLTWPFASIGFVTSMIQRAAASQTRINEFLKEKAEIVNINSEPYSFEGKIEFRNVSYTYPNSGIKAIKNLSFVLRKGESMGIVGKTGSGKSTILHLLMRQIEADSGGILIDNIPIKQVNLSDFRSQTGVVPQDVFLFSDTIKNNLLFGSFEPTVSDQRLIEITKKAHLYHNIIDFKDGFETLLGERGVNMSGGQKQRLSIARALIRDPKLLLLDDCLSAVDTETEEIILNNLNDKEITSLVVSHRISSIRNAGKILNIEDGQVIEEGTHSELIAAGGSYSELYEKQLMEIEKKS